MNPGIPTVVLSIAQLSGLHKNKKNKSTAILDHGNRRFEVEIFPTKADPYQL